MQHRLSMADNGTLVAAHVGDLIELCLQGKPSGGYRWVPEALPGALLEQVEQDFAFVRGRVGGDNETRLLFRVRTAGSGILRLRYDRTWETGETPLNTYQARIEAE